MKFWRLEAAARFNSRELNKNYTLTFAIFSHSLMGDEQQKERERHTTKCFNFAFPALLGCVFHF